MKYIELFIAGDFYPNPNLQNILRSKGGVESVFGDMSPMIKAADYSLINLECVLTESDNKINKIGPHLRATADMAGAMKEAGFDIATLANNHIYDYGEQGLKDTIQSLDHFELQHVGAGVNLADSKRTLFLKKNGIRIAIINFADNEFNHATGRHGGSLPLDLIVCSKEIATASKKVDHVFVIIHGGHEHYHYPSPEMVKRYRFFAEQGAAAVIAHHTHCVGPHEVHGGVPIIYSLGNFLFDSNLSLKSWFEGYAVKFLLTKSEVSYEVIPYTQSIGGIGIKLQDKNSDLMTTIKTLSVEMQHPELLSEKWIDYIADEQIKSGVLWRISKVSRWQKAILTRLGMLDKMYTNRHLKIIKQSLTCESHKERTRDILDKYINLES
ncbi:MAG: CapA family protein [Saccharospirillaceae bacterium]|nr:CapA family protein [Saccharospirillaceae bacterium]